MSAAKKFQRILLTNDDGFDAPGLAVLAEAAAKLSDDVWIVAPQLDQSGTGQCVTLNNPLRGISRGPKRFAVSGTPADCVVLALSHLMLDALPTLILSGVNAGNNTGDDVNISGTLGAAFTGLMLGVPAIGISLDTASRKNLRWGTAEAVLPNLITTLVDKGWPSDQCLSINIPDLPHDQIKGVATTRPGRSIPRFQVEVREDLREKEYYWLIPKGRQLNGDPQSDLAALARGEISISYLTLDRSVMPHVLQVAL